jgi:membrane fusion protein (multidrug efflux system)
VNDASRPPLFDRLTRTEAEGYRPPEEGRTEQPVRGAAAASEEPARARSRQRLRRLLFAVFGVLVIAAGIGYGWYWFTTARYFESTDDAYTQADNTTISAEISGYIAELRVTDNQQVKLGDVLLRIDDRTYRAAVDQAAADVKTAEAQIDSLMAQANLQQSQIRQAEADVTAAEANRTFAAQNNARYAQLAKTGSGTVQTAQQAEATLRTQEATLQHNQASLAAARKQLDVLTSQLEGARATLLHNQAALKQAQINLGYTVIRAPVAGAVGDRAARGGLYVQPGLRLMTIVPMRQDIYVVANFKETQLSNMYRGQQVDLSLDAFPGARLHGTIDSLAPGSGAQFTLLPPENATGNFTKIVQRVPVKIVLDPHDPVLDRLRPGLSAVVAVDTRTTPPGARTMLVAEPRR